MPDRSLDLRGEVIAEPTEEMREAMRMAEVGSYLDHEDPTVRELERQGAKCFGKEAALFLATTTMANLIACMYHCRPGDKVLLDEDSHVYRREMSGMARIAGLMPFPISRRGAIPDPALVDRATSFRKTGDTPISLLWVENTHNVAGGAIADPADLKALRGITQEYGIPIHVDGARIFNASVALKVPPAVLAESVDSMSVGFNKGVACPAGCLLVGSHELIEAAIPLRQLLGGRILKAGILAAPCIVALHSMVDRLADDHAVARELGSAIETIEGLRLESPVVTNIIRIDTSEVGPARRLVDALAAEGVLVGAVDQTVIRVVTHYHVTAADIHRVIDAFRAAVPALAVA